MSKRILTYGLHYSDYASQRELFALRANKDIEIIGEIAFDPADEEIFFCRKSIEDGLKQDFDMIVICDGAIETAYQSLVAGSQAVDRNGVMKSKLILLNDFVAPYHHQTELIQVDILKELVSATDEQVADREWLGDRLFRYGFFPFFKLVKDPQDGVHYSTCGILQVPDEFLDFCHFIGGLRFDSAMEIGVARGGSSYIIAALLYRNNPEMKYHMVDIADNLVHFEETSRIIPSLDKCIPHTSDDYVGNSYGFCFIDADHSYEGIMTDWKNVGRFASGMVVFHDIYAHEYDNENGGTVRGWREIKASSCNERIREITKYPDRWMGIGVIER